MKYRGLVAVLLAAAIVVTATSSFALDGARKGFIAGFGLGPAMTSFSPEGFDSESKFGLATDFRLGAGINEQLLIYYESRVAWFKQDIINQDLANQTVTATFGVGLLGASYYLKEDVPCFYLLGSAGLSAWSNPFESTGETWTGLGLSVGVGYEFSKHWTAEATFNYGTPGKDDVTIDVMSVMITVGGIAY